MYAKGSFALFLTGSIFNRLNITNMIYTAKVFTKSTICIALVLFSIDVKAQASLVQQTVDKLESFKNFSYQSVYKQLEHTSDTTVIYHKDVFSKAAGDTTFGYLFTLESLIKGNTAPLIEVYNGQKLINIMPGDSTYEIAKIRPYVISNSLPGGLNWIKNYAEKITQVRDTIINAVNTSHLVINAYDTIINKEHYYTRIHLFIDKLSGMPDRIVAVSRNKDEGGAITNYYSEQRFFDYKFNQPDIDIASITIPKGFHLPKAPPVLLAPGTTAPGWALTTAEGKNTSLSQLKGKVVMLDFFFIGCHGCMLSIDPLNKLYEKYKGRNFEIVSLTERDSAAAIKRFKKKYNIKYPIYINAADVVNKYNVTGFPTFYFIDKEGKDATVFVGHDKGFEEKISSIVDGLLAK